MRIIEQTEEQQRLEFAQKAGRFFTQNPWFRFYGTTTQMQDICPGDLVAIRHNDGMVVVLRADEDFEPVIYPEMYTGGQDDVVPVDQHEKAVDEANRKIHHITSLLGALLKAFEVEAMTRQVLDPALLQSILEACCTNLPRSYEDERQELQRTVLREALKPFSVMRDHHDEISAAVIKAVQADDRAWAFGN